VKLDWQTLKRIVPLLPTGARTFLWVYTIASSALAGLDVVALMLLAVSLSGMVQNRPIHLPVVGTVEPSGYVWILVAVCALIILKSVAAVGLQWMATRRFAQYELQIGDRLFDAYIKAPWTERLRRSTSQLTRLADVGIASIVGGFMLPLLTIPSMFTTFIAVVVVLVVAQPVTALITLVYLGLVGAVLYLWVARKSIEAGRVNRTYSFRVAGLMTDMVNALKEITLRNSAPSVAKSVHDNRIHTTRSRSNLSFLGMLPKFVFDAALVGGFLLVGGAAYFTGGIVQAFSAVALFGVAGYRLVPSLTGFQSVMTLTHGNVAIVGDVLNDIDQSVDYVRYADTVGRAPIVGVPRELVLSDVEFVYPKRTEPALTGIDLTVPMGSTVGIVGSSGAGKTTLVDLLLGLLTPSKGTIEIDGVNLEDVLMDWRSRVGYVPQDVSLFNGTVAQNVALTWDDDFDREKVRTALERAQLWETIAARPSGMDASIGDRGLALSGGQRQRLGIARALYGDPLVLVMDEATSALDTKTESDVAFAIRNLKGQVTIISVAHRLSTIRDSDQVCFMRDGTIVARGTFDEVVQSVPDFAVQAALAGLTK
jgi:ABC-type multidrug transport system, ATPase and permease components